MSPASSYVLPNLPAREETAVIFTLPEDSVTYLREILKFLGTVALIATAGMLLLLAG